MLISAAGVRLNVVDRGEGAPVVLVHGLGCSGAVWATAAERLRPERRTVTVELRGHGASDRTYGSLTVEDLAADVARVLGHLDVGPADVVGHSMGGMVAQHLALGWPETVRRLVLCGTTAGPTPDIQDVTRQLADLARAQGSDALAQMMAPMMFAPGYAGAALEAFVISFGSCDPEVLGICLDAIVTFSVTDRLADLAVPTVVIVGEHDAYLEDCRRLAEAVPGAELVVLPGLGHMAPTEGPDAFADALIDALSGGGGPGR